MFFSKWLRVIVFILALGLFLYYTFFPSRVTTEMGGGNMYYIMLSLLGMCFAFVYGIGYIPSSRVFKFLTHPVVVILLLVVPFLILKYK